MNKTVKWFLAAVLVLVIFGVVLLLRGPPDAAEEKPASAAAEGEQSIGPGPELPPRPAPAPPARVYPPVPLVPGIGKRPTPGAPPIPGQPPYMPYRPAELLRYSDLPAGNNYLEDDTSPVLKRICSVSKCDPEQQEQIRQLWHKHEDGRRALLAKTPERRSGPPVLDAQKLQALDASFETPIMTGVLRPDQGARLAQEIYPPEVR